ncbi:hypothetical protein PPYR_12005 [Photinus pyralis]|uniref:Tektin n=1 Tax=Photinus pyralis TaxID=7054 RepID=A0A1Y1MT15_PHOPY|nr:tektin-1-like [Photinus pyralis]KAB0795166.1 hypothetical protein PPYR_12005 [Photinus pyralis]
MNSTLKLYEASVVPVPPPPSRFTLNEWYLNNRVRYRTCLDQQQLADKILAECERGREQIQEIALMNKREVDHKIEERIGDITFNKGELVRQRKEVCLEINNLSIYNERIVDALAFLKNQALPINRKCIVLREGRLGIDMCHDDVERELLKETEILESAMSLLYRVMEQGNEQLRRLRSTIYFMDRDLEDKDNVLKIDAGNLSINQNSMNLSMYHGFTPLDPSNITAEEWEVFTRQNIARAAKEINSACCLRSYVNTLIGQVMEDLRNQADIVNEAFRRRIDEIKEAKTKLEVNHSEISRQTNEMTRNILQLEKTLSTNEGFMALSHTRLGKRAQRPGMELCRDLVEVNLVNEVRELRDNCAALQQLLAEAQASLRYLLKTQIQLEEDVNVKTNSLKIDEVDCMTLRQGLDYHNY